MDLDTEAAAAVLNGTARVGDTVAFAVRDGNQAAMRMGTVLGFETRYTWNDEPYRRMKVRVSLSSGYSNSTSAREYTAGIEKFNRVVLICDPADDHE